MWLFDTQQKDIYKTGYRVEPLPLYTGSRAPIPLGEPKEIAPQPNTEPIVVSVAAWTPSHNLPLSNTSEGPDMGGEYIVFYYVGQIGEDAVRATFANFGFRRSVLTGDLI